jgi:hypothetical protein
VHGTSAEVDQEATDLLRAAVLLLRDDFARNDPETGKLLRISWDQLSRFEVRVAPDLRVEIVDVPKCGPLTVPVNAISDSRAFTLYLTKSSLIRNVEAGGRAIAQLFTANRRSVAQAWLAACESAKSESEALLLELASDRQKEEEAERKADIAVRMAALQNETVLAHSQGRPLHTDAAQRILASPSHIALSTLNPLSPQAPSSRGLADPSRYRLVDPRGSVTGEPLNEGPRRVNTGSGEAIGGATPKVLRLLTSPERLRNSTPGRVPIPRLRRNRLP